MQDPVLFSGTMRYNLDPYQEYTDQRLWSVLEQVSFPTTSFPPSLLLSFPLLSLPALITTVVYISHIIPHIYVVYIILVKICKQQVGGEGPV